MVRQPAETQTIYAELSERLRALEGARSFASLTGAFTKKRVAGGDYWYFKTSEGPAGQREYFVGADNRETQALMKSYAAGRGEAQDALANVERLCAVVRQGDGMPTERGSATVGRGPRRHAVFHGDWECSRGALAVGYAN